MNDDQKAVVDKLFTEFSDIFAEHRFEIGYKRDLRIKPTAKRVIRNDEVVTHRQVFI